MSFVVWGFLPLFLKQVENHDGFVIIYYRVLFAALLMCCYLMLHFRKNLRVIFSLKKKSMKQIILMFILTALGGILLDMNWDSYVYTVNHISIHTAAFSYMIVPIMTALLATFILGEKLNHARWFGILLSAFSCYLIGHVSLKEAQFILVIALSYSLYIISQRKNTLLPRAMSLALQMMIGSLVMICFHPYVFHVQAALDVHFWIFILIISAFFTVTPLILNLIAMNGMKASQLSYLIYMNPIISFLIGVFLYKEKMDKLTLIAYALLTVALFIFNWEWIAKKPSESESQIQVSKSNC